jgi:hypothetical protein
MFQMLLLECVAPCTKVGTEKCKRVLASGQCMLELAGVEYVVLVD